MAQSWIFRFDSIDISHVPGGNDNVTIPNFCRPLWNTLLVPLIHQVFEFGFQTSRLAREAEFSEFHPPKATSMPLVYLTDKLTITAPCRGVLSDAATVLEPSPMLIMEVSERSPVEKWVLS